MHPLTPTPTPTPTTARTLAAPPRVVAAVLALAAGAVASAHAALVQAPERAPLAQTDRAGDQAPWSAIAEVQRGQRVRVLGRVTRVLDADEFRIEDHTGSIRVNIPWNAAAPVNIGDRVTVEGVVDDNLPFGLPRPEIYASRLQLPGGADIRFDHQQPPQHQHPTTTPTTAPSHDTAITPIAALTRGQHATIRGRIERILDADEFRIADDSGSVRVYIGWTNRIDAAIGDFVTLTGVLDDDPWPLRAEFYAHAITTQDGATTNLRQHDDAKNPYAVEHHQTPTQTSNATQPTTPAETTPIADLRPYDIARVTGVVDRITDHDEFRIRDDSGSIRVYIGWRNPMPVTPGDRVTLTGIVDAEGPGAFFREIYAYDITLADGRTVALQPSNATPTHHHAPERASPNADRDAQPTTPIAQVRRGQHVTLVGVVERIRDTDEFTLRDDTGAIRVYIGYRNRMPVTPGQRVTVIGHADDDVFPGRRPEIYATRIITPEGRAIPLRRDD